MCVLALRMDAVKFVCMCGFVKIVSSGNLFMFQEASIEGLVVVGNHCYTENEDVLDIPFLLD